MGKIHEALQRAEQQRAEAGAAPGGAGSLEHAFDRRTPPPRWSRRGRSRSSAVVDGRRSRVVLTDSESAVSEQYRTLRTRVQSLRRSRPIRSLVVTSAVPREGKTTTAVNLALSFGLEIEQRTCLVDADLRTPAVHRMLPELPEAGLGEVLEGRAELEDALVEIPETRLSVLPVNLPPSQPSELLASRRMVELLATLHERFDTIVIDPPPVLVLPDTTTLVDICDSVILVVGTGQASRDDVRDALGRIDSSKLLGTVLNRSEDPPPSYGYYYGGRVG